MEALQKVCVDAIKSHALRLALGSPRAQTYVLTEYLWAEEGAEQAALSRTANGEPPAWLAKLIAAQMGDERRHATLLRARLDELGAPPPAPAPKLALAKIWWLDRAVKPYLHRFEAGPIVVLLAVAARLEATGVRLFTRHLAVLARDVTDPETAEMLRDILSDEQRHAKSCAAAAKKLVRPFEQATFDELSAIVAKIDRSFGVTLALRYWLTIVALVARDRISPKLRVRRVVDRSVTAIRERAQARIIELRPKLQEGPRVAIVSDTTDNIDGVAIGLRRLVAAATRAGHTMSLVGPSCATPADNAVVRITSAMSAALPMYPQYTWSVPELPALTEHLAKHADLVQLATPGPMGLAGLIAARMLGLPVLAQYHTEVPEYAARMTGMPFVKGLVEPFVGWFYQQADLCLAPSQAVSDRLISLGVPADRIARVQRGVDLALFDPARRDRIALARYDIAPTTPVALYVGRLSKEKNLDALRTAWTAIHAQRPDARLLVVGDGPVTFTGPGIATTGVLHGTELATIFASADVFLFPSETETFGNVVVEAAASGLPVVVSSKGASHEHVTPSTGLVVDTDYATAVLALFSNPERRATMATAAREHALTYDLSLALAQTFAIYGSITKHQKAA